MSISNDQIVMFVQEKIREKNEVIREQQLQIQDLQQKVSDLEQQLNDARTFAAEREELFRKLSEIVD